MPKLDLNDPDFLKDWFSLEKSDQLALLKTLRKLGCVDFLIKV
jgi:hypothetical protein